jgi:hypothetical protein
MAFFTVREQGKIFEQRKEVYKILETEAKK